MVPHSVYTKVYRFDTAINILAFFGGGGGFSHSNISVINKAMVLGWV